LADVILQQFELSRIRNSMGTVLKRFRPSYEQSPNKAWSRELATASLSRTSLASRLEIQMVETVACCVPNRITR
jgi:hypothetical protein